MIPGARRCGAGAEPAILISEDCVCILRHHLGGIGTVYQHAIGIELELPSPRVTQITHTVLGVNNPGVIARSSDSRSAQFSCEVQTGGISIQSKSDLGALRQRCPRHAAIKRGPELGDDPRIRRVQISGIIGDYAQAA